MVLGVNTPQNGVQKVQKMAKVKLDDNRHDVMAGSYANSDFMPFGPIIQKLIAPKRLEGAHSANQSLGLKCTHSNTN